MLKLSPLAQAGLSGLLFCSLCGTLQAGTLPSPYHLQDINADTIGHTASDAPFPTARHAKPAASAPQARLSVVVDDHTARQLDTLGRHVADADDATGKPARGKPARAQPRGPVGQAPEEPNEQNQPSSVTSLFEQRGILTPKGSFIFEPSFQYSNASTNRISIVGLAIIPSLVVGVIDIRTVDRNTIVNTLAGRYGLTNRLELEGRVPYVFRDDSTVGRTLEQESVSEDIFNSDGDGIGDVEVAARYQLNAPTAGPYFIAGLRVKTRTGTGPFEVPIDCANGIETELPTGSGFLGIQPSLTGIYSTDPAVFFGSVSFLWNQARDINTECPNSSGITFGKLEPGNVVGFNLGMAFGLNERTSFSVGYDHSTVQRSKFNGDVLTSAVTTQVGSMAFGYSYRFNKKYNLNLTLGVGATDAAPDIQLTVRVPIKF